MQNFSKLGCYDAIQKKHVNFLRKGEKYKMAVERLNTDAFLDVMTAMDEAISEFSTVRDSVERSTESLLSNWDGQAKSSFEDAWDTLKLYMSNENDMLEVMKEDLESIRTAYMDWDDSMASTIEGE